MTELSEQDHLPSRAATVADAPGVAACLASAFHKDPLWGEWMFPSEATRVRGMLRFMEFWAGCEVRRPWMRVTQKCESVAAWVAPGEIELTGEDEERLGHLLRDLLGERASEVEEVFEQFDAHHPQDRPHFYLSWWATHSDHSGQGVGSALMNETLALIDAEHMPAYLESTNPANLPRYEALGFVTRDTLGPPNGPVVTTMWRDARR